MIYYFTPFIEKNLGQAYNHYCEIVPHDDDWITFMDGDIMQLHMDWGKIWSTILNQNNQAGIVTCLTNRVSKGNADQVCINMYDETNVIQHKKYAEQLFLEKQYSVKEMKGHFLSGFFFSFKKSTWKQIGGFMNGILHVDKDFFNKVKSIQKPCLVAEGFYVLHYYRMMEGHNFINHLK